jgi:hypothetical protein
MPAITVANNAAIANTINGAKELKKYIQDMTRLAESIREVCERDLQQPRAVVNYHHDDFISVGQGNHEFNARMCQVAHSDFVYNHTQLSQSSVLLKYESIVKDCLASLERFRVSLVNNKQQKRTTIRAIRRIIIAHTNSCRGSAEVFEEIAYQSPCVIMLRGLIEQTKQNHKTIARNILDQVHPIVLDMRTRHIHMFEQAAQQTVEAIIIHADKCRVFMTQCRYLAIVEYCANLWWTHTQKEHYCQQNNNYYVSALLAEDNGELKRFNAASASGLSVAASGGRRRLMNVQIFVHEHNEMQPEKDECIVMYDLDESLATEILTDEAIQTFEDDERDAKDAVREHQRLYANAATAATTDDQVWNYWGRRSDAQHEYLGEEAMLS